MKILYAALVIVVCVVSGLAGLTAGINLNPDSTVRFVPNWGSVGDWVAGVGAMLAVGVALWQMHVMHRDDREEVVINQRQGSARWMIEAVSRGKRPVRVVGVALYSRRFDTLLHIKQFIFHGSKVELPLTLGYAENIILVTDPGMLADLAANATLTFDDMQDLEVVIKTTLGEFKAPVIEETKQAFIRAMSPTESIFDN